jgi:hypothetical protein
MSVFKHIVALLALQCCVGVALQAQQVVVDTSKQTVSNYTLAKQYYKKAGAFRTTGFVFAGATFLTGVVAMRQTAVEIALLPLTVFTGDAGRITNAGKWWTASIICAAASIPCFIAAGRYSRKARLLPYANPGATLSSQALIPNTASVGVTLTLPLGH